jgi:hypothetical protein
MRLLGEMTGIEEEKQGSAVNEKMMMVYANLFAGKTEIVIQIPGDRCKNSGISIEIYDMCGRIVKLIPLTLTKIEIGHEIPPGVYFIKAKGFQTEKIIKLR